MILFVTIAVWFLWYTTFSKEGFIAEVKIALTTDKPIRNVLKNIAGWFALNVCFNFLNAVAVYIISVMVTAGLMSICPKEASHWSFNINALQDNLVTEGEWYGRRGHVDSELSYFYSRTLPQGEKISHIPANKTYVRYDNDARPHIEVHQTQSVIPEWLYKVFWIEMFNGKHTEYYVIVVPEGTISVSGEYEIDMG